MKTIQNLFDRFLLSNYSTKSRLPQGAAMSSKDILKTLSGDPAVRFQRLCDWRHRTASAKGVAAFRVFSNRTLRDLALKGPKTFEELTEVTGIGPKKSSLFGAELLTLLHSC
jgi:ribonuclease D